jgi:hypothetical protein
MDFRQQSRNVAHCLIFEDGKPRKESYVWLAGGVVQLPVHGSTHCPFVSRRLELTHSIGGGVPTCNGIHKRRNKIPQTIRNEKLATGCRIHNEIGTTAIGDEISQDRKLTHNIL